MKPSTAVLKADRIVSASKAGLITTALTLANVILGFTFQSIVAARLGLSETSDDFQLAWSVVTFGTVIFFSLVPVLLVPRLENPMTRAISIGDWPKFAVLGAVLTSIQLVAASLCEPQLAEILRWSAPSHFFAAMTAIPQTIAYVRKRFVAAGIGPAVNGAALLGVFLWIGEGQSAAGLGCSLAAGYFGQMLVVTASSIRRSGPFHRGSQVPMTLFLFLLGFTLLSKFQPLLERILSLGGPIGSTATLGFGQKIAQGLLLFAAFGLALTANATLARRVRAGEIHGAAELLAKTIVTTIVFSSVVVLGLLPLQKLVITLLFVRGQFTPADARDVGDVLLSQLPWVISCAVAGALTSYLYIERSYGRVAFAALIGLAVTLTSASLLQSSLPLTAVPIASSFGAAVTLFWVSWLVVKSPIWLHLRRQLAYYRALLVLCVAAVALSFSAAVATRLSAGDDVLGIDMLLGILFGALVMYARLSTKLWAQCQAAIGGKL